MSHFTVNQERHAACLCCPHCAEMPFPCRKEICSLRHQDTMRQGQKRRKQILAVCHWLYDENLSYFRIKEEW